MERMNFLALDPLVLEELGQGGRDELRAVFFLVGIEPEIGDAEAKEIQRAVLADSELSNLERAGAKIDRDDFGCGCHEVGFLCE